MRFIYDNVTGALEDYASSQAPHLLKKALELCGRDFSLILKKSTLLEMHKSEHFVAANKIPAEEIKETFKIGDL